MADIHETDIIPYPYRKRAVILISPCVFRHVSERLSVVCRKTLADFQTHNSAFATKDRRALRVSMKNFQFCIDKFFVGKSKQLHHLMHQIIFVFIHFPVNEDHFPEDFNNSDLFFA